MSIIDVSRCERERSGKSSYVVLKIDIPLPTTSNATFPSIIQLCASGSTHSHMEVLDDKSTELKARGSTICQRVQATLQFNESIKQTRYFVLERAYAIYTAMNGL